MKYSAESYVFSTLVCVGFVELFRVRFCYKTEQPTRVFLFLFPPIHPGFVFFVHSIIARWILVAYGRCLWPLGAYVIEPPNRGSLFSDRDRGSWFLTFGIVNSGAKACMLHVAVAVTVTN